MKNKNFYVSLSFAVTYHEAACAKSSGCVLLE